jgi:hypothetical protein
VEVLDEHTVAWPELRGNGVLATLGNIAENPHVGLLLVDFVDDVVGLHVNGRARVVETDRMRRERGLEPADAPPGRRALVWVEVQVEEAYIHCSKNIPHLARADDPSNGLPRRNGGDFFAARSSPPVRPFRP